MVKVLRILAVLVMLGLMLLPTVALADTTPASEVQDGGVWGDGINASFAHNSFYAAGRHWVIYPDGNGTANYYNIIAASTADYGATWQYYTVKAGVMTTFRQLAVWYNVTTNEVSYVRAEYILPTGFFTAYGQGTPNSDGTMTLSAESMVDVAGGNIASVAHCVDADGLPWAAWTEDIGSGNYTPMVDRSSVHNGTWVSAVHKEDFLTGNLTGGNITCYYISLTPIQDDPYPVVQIGFTAQGLGGVYGTNTAGLLAAWGYGNNTFIGSYNPSTVEVVVPIADGAMADTLDGSGLYKQTAFSFYSTGVVPIAVWTDAAGDVNYKWRGGGGGNWTSNVATELKPNGGLFWFPAIAGYALTDSGEDLIVVVHDTGAIYYRKYNFETVAWDASWTLAYVVPDIMSDVILLQNIQYSYNYPASPVGFPFMWGDWSFTPNGPPAEGILSYWWIDKAGTTAGENPLGYYYAYHSPTGTSTMASVLSWAIPTAFGIMGMMFIFSLVSAIGLGVETIILALILGVLVAVGMIILHSLAISTL